MKKIGVVFLILLVCLGIAGTGFFYRQFKVTSKERDTYIQQNSVLQESLNAIGEMTQVYTVRTSMDAGAEVKEEDIISENMPVASVHENFVTSISSIVGKYYKVSIDPGTPLTLDLIMDDAEMSEKYERDLTFAYLPLGLKVGDYVDVRITLPYGEEFTVLEHMRIYQLVLKTNTVKLRLNEAQLALWVSAKTDYALFIDKGASLYVTKYVEPGLNLDVKPFYPVRAEMEKSVTVNPNITNKNVCINSVLRKEIDSMLANVLDSDGGKLNTGITNEATNINTAKDFYLQDNSNDDVSVSDNTYDTFGSMDGELQEVGDSISMDIGMDAEGNASIVTPDDEFTADGENVSGVDETIE